MAARNDITGERTGDKPLPYGEGRNLLSVSFREQCAHWSWESFLFGLPKNQYDSDRFPRRRWRLAMTEQERGQESSPCPTEKDVIFFPCHSETSAHTGRGNLSFSVYRISNTIVTDCHGRWRDLAMTKKKVRSFMANSCSQ